VIGNQGDPAFWKQFMLDFPEELDIFIDDGGHTMTQQTVTFESMFWGVRDGGIYLCEDLHTSYWEEFEGGYLKNNSMIERFKSLVDTINAWHSKEAGSQVRVSVCTPEKQSDAHRDCTPLPTLLRWIT